MASGVVMSFRSPGIRPCMAAHGGNRKPDGHRRRNPGRGSGGSWWTPIFGWPSESNYIDREASVECEAQQEATDVEVQRPAKRFAAFTEDKARELRMRMMEIETFHDGMYHSTIASRLASDVSHLSGD